MKNIIKKIQKNENESIVIFVVSAMLLILALVMIIYFSVSNKVAMQNKNIDQIKNKYRDSSEIDQTYERLENSIK